MPILYDQMADRQYREGMRESIHELRGFATRTTTDLTPELARAIWLAIPAVRWGHLGDEQLNVEMNLDLIAAHEYGGYHGYDAEWIEDRADHIVGLWLMENRR